MSNQVTVLLTLVTSEFTHFTQTVLFKLVYCNSLFFSMRTNQISIQNSGTRHRHIYSFLPYLHWMYELKERFIRLGKFENIYITVGCLTAFEEIPVTVMGMVFANLYSVTIEDTQQGRSRLSAWNPDGSAWSEISRGGHLIDYQAACLRRLSRPEGKPCPGMVTVRNPSVKMRSTGTIKPLYQIVKPLPPIWKKLPKNYDSYMYLICSTNSPSIRL